MKNIFYLIKIIFSIKFLIKKENILILGNSKIIKTKKIGRYIDKHFNIIRINLPPKKEYYEYVGKRTYIQTINDDNHLIIVLLYIYHQIFYNKHLKTQNQFHHQYYVCIY